MSGRKSLVQKNDINKVAAVKPQRHASEASLSSSFNYQKEVKQLKKDLRLKDEKLVLLSKELSYKKETLTLLQNGLQTKDDLLQLKEKEGLNFEQELKLYTEKAELLEKENEELQREVQKQTKLAAMATKKQSITEQTNLTLLQQINALAQNLNNMKNVNMALSSQLTMTMSAAQHHMFGGAASATAANGGGAALVTSPRQQQQQHQQQQLVDIVPNVSTTSTVNDDIEQQQQLKSAQQSADSEDDDDDDVSDKTSEADAVEKVSLKNGEKSVEDESHDYVTTDLKDSSKAKGRLDKKRHSKRMSQSKGRRQKGDGQPPIAFAWDDDASHKKDKDEEDKKDKKKTRKKTDISLDEVEEPDNDDAKGNRDHLDFGAAPVDKDKRKRKKTGKGGGDVASEGVCFDTFLDGLESDKLKITKNGRLVAMDYFTDSLYIISSNGFSSGKHEWELKTVKTGDLVDEIGVCSNWGNLAVEGNGISDMGSSQLGARAVYANDHSSGVAFHDAYDNDNVLTYDKKFKKKANGASEFVWGKSDVIKVVLNCNKWSMKFYLNNKQVGKSVSLTPELTYYPILCAYGSCSYQVLSYKEV